MFRHLTNLPHKKNVTLVFILLKTFMNLVLEMQ